MTLIRKTIKDTQLQQLELSGEVYYSISHVDQIPPFFMSIVSDSNHWMFISSNGGLTAGRIDADHSLFPYYTDDKVTETFDQTGSKSIFRVDHEGQQVIWEPFSNRFEGLYNYSRNLYKNVLGNKLLFEEINHDLGLTFSYEWSSSDRFGFVRESSLINDTDKSINVEVLDGIQNIMPYGVTSDTQFIRSNLVDAYKKSELEAEAGLGIYALSAIIVDRAEPSEALKANIAWSIGLENPTYLISSHQLEAFRKGESITQEDDIKAKKGAYLTVQNLSLKPGTDRSWLVLADVNQSAASIAAIIKKIQESKDLITEVKEDVAKGTVELTNLTSASDSLQLSNDERKNTRHYSNTLFNIMRGGIFDDNYEIDKHDFCGFVQMANKALFEKEKSRLNKLADQFTHQQLSMVADESEDDDLIRLVTEYLPLKFSRRHGDPSRPWNKFSINTKDEAGNKVLDYEGNWRDIFQNWEALAHAYPEFIEGMIFKFLNASTFDGYNPYRVTKDGFDWEAIEEHDPWSYIGYWGDHQIIYLLKFLEFLEDHKPGRLAELFGKRQFVFANVPYKIKSYEDTLKNPKDTIEFDDKLDKLIRERRIEKGADGALLQDDNSDILRVNLVEKILVTALAKLSNFIPEAGIWMNTQRPEWNDANNALVGNGVSMVTLCYLRRFFAFFQGILDKPGAKTDFQISGELYEFFQKVDQTLNENEMILSGKVSDKDRRVVLDGLGEAGSEYRLKVYEHGFTNEKEIISVDELKTFSERVLKYLDHSIRANKRADGMFHAYNLMSVEKGEVSIGYLDEMLEGQVAVLSSGKLKPEESVQVLDALKNSSLFRPDQYSYVLYPNKELPRFIAKNNIPKAKVKSSELLKKLVKDGNIQIVEKDINGLYHFNGKFTNAGMLAEGLSSLNGYDKLVKKDTELVLQIFEDVFNHKAFTGRSGTFFGYEGLGSIYWHMVSKLLVAVQECCLSAIEQGADEVTVGKLLEHYYEIYEGIGVNKSPALYGAFPTDPYSHTPFGKGVQQPGMTGQVKEDILTRIGELGVKVKDGQIHFEPSLLKADEFLQKEATFAYVDIHQTRKSIQLSKDSLAFTYCQVPVVYHIAEKEGLKVFFSKGSSTSFHSTTLNHNHSEEVFERKGVIESIEVSINKSRLR